MKKSLLFAIFLFCSCLSYGQDYKLKSIVSLPGDMYARQNMVNDQPQGGVPCAVLRIATTGISAEQRERFRFEPDWGSYIAERRKDGGDICLFVSPGLKMLKIFHEQLGNLIVNVPQELGSTIESLHTYKIQLEAIALQAKTPEEQKTQTGWLVIKSVPEKASVFIDNEFMGETPFQRKMSLRTYNYTLKKDLYHELSGSIVLNQSKVEETLSLKPAFGSLKVNTEPSGACVSVDGKEQEKATPCTVDNLPSGQHKITIRREMYRPVEQEVLISDGQQQSLTLPLDRRFAKITLKNEAGGELYVNGESKGQGMVTLDLLEGFYDVEARAVSHRDAQLQVEVVANEDKTYSLKPQPIYASLDVISEPMEAEVYINGEYKGLTPLTLEQLLVGTYKVELKKAGCAGESQSITLKEKESNSIRKTLKQQQGVTPDPEINESKITKKEINDQRSQKTIDIEADPQHRTHTVDRNYLILNASASMQSHLAFGVSYGCVKRLGWFVSLMSGTNFKGLSSQMECDENGQINGVLPFYTGDESYTRLSAIGGLAYRVAGPLCLQAGIGYGFNCLSWKTEQGQWAKNSAYSSQGLDISAGMLLTTKNIAISLDAVSTNFKTLEIKLGIGLVLRDK